MATCWDTLCGSDCAWCLYKQARYKQGFATPCWAWFQARKIPKNCRHCRFYLEARKQNADLPEDPSWRPVTQ